MAGLGGADDGPDAVRLPGDDHGRRGVGQRTQVAGGVPAGGHPDRDLGFGHIVASEIEEPNT